MDNKTFKKVNDECLKSFGFEKKKKEYYLNLPNILIRLEYTKFPLWDGIVMSYVILIKELAGLQSTDYESIDKAFWTPGVRPQMGIFASVYVDYNNKLDRFIEPEKCEETKWRESFQKALERVFGPYKKDDLKQMKRAIRSKDITELIAVAPFVEVYLKRH